MQSTRRAASDFRSKMKTPTLSRTSDEEERKLIKYFKELSAQKAAASVASTGETPDYRNFYILNTAFSNVAARFPSGEASRRYDLQRIDRTARRCFTRLLPEL